MLRGSRTIAARFGMSVMNAGDIDRNGYNDVIVGAPNEKANDYAESTGAIYIYYSSQNGIDWNRFQVVLEFRSSTENNLTSCQLGLYMADRFSKRLRIFLTVIRGVCTC